MGQSLLIEEPAMTRDLHIVKNGESVIMKDEEIFDSTRFTKLWATTFVASPKFFFESTKTFEEVELLIGIEKNVVLTNFEEGIRHALSDQKLDFWNDIGEEMREKFLSNRYSIRYSRPGILIHSKIYLLSNEATGETRVILGSANFTNSGFGKKGQFEEIMIFDNDPKQWDLYWRRYQEIRAYTLDYIPERLRKKPEPKKEIVITQETRVEYIVSELDQLEAIVIPQEEVDSLFRVSEIKKEETEQALKTETYLKTLIKVDRKKQRATFLPAEKVKKDKLYAAITKNYQKQEQSDQRPRIVGKPHPFSLYRQEGENQELVLLAKELPLEEKREQLLNLHRFISAYGLFTTREDVENQSKIYEAILYAFTSPFIWKFRECASEMHGDSARADIRPFMALAGHPRSGKTTVLEFIGMLTGHLGDRPYTSFKDYKDSMREAIMRSEFVYPLLQDEIKDAFFTGKRGEDLVKLVANDLRGPHPCMIGTTNAEYFSTHPQMLRRIYYLEINNPFKESSKRESRIYLNEVHEKVNTSLFRDFVYQMTEAIHKGEEIYDPDDFLKKTRDIFRGYYEETGVKIPNYFPQGMFNDYEKRGSLIWRNLYEQYPNCFRVNEELNEIFVDSQLFVGRDSKEKKSTLQFLPPNCKKESQILLLDKNAFYEFIGKKEKKRGFFQFFWKS